MLSFERLKELKAEFEQMRKYNDRHYMSTITEDDVLEALDEAIARQSVKSEDVEEAIEVLSDPMEWVCGDYVLKDQYDKASILAITALQAYQPTTRKDRTVEEAAISKMETTSCEWCEGNVSKYFDVNWYDFNGHERLDKSNYCPNCGRKLN